MCRKAEKISAVISVNLRPRIVNILLAFSLIFAYSTGTIQRNKIYRDGLVLWQDALSKSAHKSRPHHNLAYYYEEKGWLKEAEAEYQKAIILNPYNTDSFLSLGIIYDKMDLTEKAINNYKRVIALDPLNPHITSFRL